jgi:energy-coupling factor transport system substrate-specific component
MSSSSAAAPAKLSRLRWRVVDIVVAVVIGLACGVIFFAWDFVGDSIGDFLKLIYLPLKGIPGGLWLIGGVIGGLVIRKPGAALLVEVVASLVQALLGNQWGLLSLASGVCQGLGAELVFLICWYRLWKLPVAILAALGAAVCEWVFEIFAWYAGYSASFKWQYLIFLAISGAVLAGVLGWLVQRGLAHTGVLDRFESGREVRPRA